MAVLSRQRNLGDTGSRAFTARVPYECYKAVEDYAWERRLTYSAAVSQLLATALAIESGGESDAVQIGETAADTD